VLAVGANLLSALANVGDRFYMLVYTHWLKRHSTQNIHRWGSWGDSSTGRLYWDFCWAAWVILQLCFCGPAALWALALMIRDDYAKVGNADAAGDAYYWQIWLYTLLLVPNCC